MNNRCPSDPVPADSPPFSGVHGPCGIISLHNATRLKSEPERKFSNVFIAPYSTPDNRYYRVRAGVFNSGQEAMDTAQRLAGEGRFVYVSPLDWKSPASATPVHRLTSGKFILRSHRAKSTCWTRRKNRAGI